MKINHKMDQPVPKPTTKPTNAPQKSATVQTKTAPQPKPTAPTSVPKATKAKPEVSPQKPTIPQKKYAQDSANQWYTAGKPLKAAPKLSKLSLGQTVKLKPAPSIKQAVANRNNLPKTKQKRVI